ncbi:MAG: hypothetical protein Athens101410_31 [Parcubacteria group bacterium Athens1014_10]|nr:MAG: hypothetical protein Athens101410_31 [Parcubacteria group bacterium Athens1014_10]TSD06057.1 MAG: hypothetical protein Athens071412_31 [Parcubacteria group bacterium Athens0714_12]
MQAARNKKGVNDKFKIKNPKQIQNPNDKNSKQFRNKGLEYLNLKFV